MSKERNKQKTPNTPNTRGIAVQILLDNQKNQLESLLSAALLARKQKVQLQGLFIEEENQIRAADFPLSREVSLWSAEERHVSGESVHRTMRANARLQQKTIEKMAIAKKIDYSFEVIRGEKMNWIKENSNSSKILFIGGHDLKPKPFQYLKYCSEVIPPLIALFDGSIASERALKIAVQISKKNNNKSLLILLLVDDLLTEEFLKNQLNTIFQKHSDIAISVEAISKKHLTSRLRRQAINMLISPSGIELTQDEGIFSKLIHQIHCPIVLVN